MTALRDRIAAELRDLRGDCRSTDGSVDKADAILALVAEHTASDAAVEAAAARSAGWRAGRAAARDAITAKAAAEIDMASDFRKRADACESDFDKRVLLTAARSCSDRALALAPALDIIRAIPEPKEPT